MTPNPHRGRTPAWRVSLAVLSLLLLTSRWEGSPNVVKEAMACNLPIVTTDVGDVRQVLGRTRNCAVCEPSPQALAQGIRAVLEDGGRTDGRSQIAHLSSDAVAVRVLEVYRHVLGKGGRL